MLYSYVKIALRNLLKHKGYAIINISGLAIGIATCILIFLFLRHEWSFDSFHGKSDQLYRVIIQETQPDGTIGFRQLQPPALAAPMVQSFGGIVQATRLVRGAVTIIKDNQSYAETLVEADSSLFRMFSFPLIAGDPQTVLRDPNTMVIDEEIAQKYFDAGPGDYVRVVGQTLSVKRGDEIHPFLVSGVMRKVPSNSSIQMKMVISFENYEQEKIRLGGNDWGGKNSLYVELDDGHSPIELEATMASFTATQFQERIQGRRDGGYIGDGPNDFRLRLQPLKELHLNPDIGVSYEAATHNPLYSYVLSGIALLVLFIACINFMTLSIGRSASRAREVGVRKVFGAYRIQLMKQFWGEAILMSSGGLCLGVLLAGLALPLFNQLTQQTLSLDAFSSGWPLVLLAALAGSVGLVAGSYPAILLSRFQPASVLKGPVKTGGKNRLMSSLVVVQYTLSIGLMICAGLIGQQLDYIQSKDLGYSRENLVAVQTGRMGSRDLVEKYRNGLMRYDSISGVVASGYSFTRGGDRISWENAEGVQRWAWAFGVDYDFRDLMGMELVDGRDFDRSLSTDPTSSVLVNESLVKEFGLNAPIGHKLDGWATWFMKEPPTIVGVVRDFNFESLHEPIRPAIMTMHPDYHGGIGAILVKMKSGNLSKTMELLEEEWRSVAPDSPFSFSFLEDDIANQYRAERRWAQIIGYASGLAILIACMGLFGLATLAVTNRTREIGIRKILGASVPGMLVLISKDFVKLVTIAAVLSWPLAFLSIDQWLAAFTYRIEIGPVTFLMASASAVLIALGTLSYQAIRAAIANPVQSMRYE